MPVVAKIDELGKPAWIALIVLSFCLFWPLGLAILAYVIWSGRMGCWSKNGVNRWQEKASRMQQAGTWWHPQSSGNRAFDEYRADTLRRLEEEQKEFRDFLDRLRMARDKQEFDQFMADRRSRAGEMPTPPQTYPQS